MPPAGTFSWLLPASSISYWWLVITTAPVINGRDVAKQYCSIEDDMLFFVRMEDSKGDLLRNIYRFQNHTLGCDVSDQSKEQWSLGTQRFPGIHAPPKTCTLKAWLTTA